MSSKKVVLELDLHDGKDKQKALRVVSKLPRIDSIAMDMKAKKLTVIGDVDPITVVDRLRKYWPTSIASVGPAKEPEKKKDGGGGGGGGGKNKDIVDSIPAYPYGLPYYPQPVVTYNPHVGYPQHINSHYALPPPMPAHYASFHEEDPNGCAIC